MAGRLHRAADSIAALATPPGRGGIGIIRVSGKDLSAFAARLCGVQPAPRQARLATFRDAGGRAIDQGILLYFAAPHSYTGEDVLELQGHGGPAVMRALLARCVELGARLAEPGEFSKRAYLNDKLDLAQAEAVADLIDAGSSQAARAALRSLSGEFSDAVGALDRQLIELRTVVEATLDFPDDEIDPLQDTDLLDRFARLRSGLDGLLVRSRQGKVLRDGLQVVLAGVPNVGKSSLLNRLAGEDRAIVTHVAGTTRDVLREAIEIDGVPLHVADTAGLREAGDAVERIGVERAWREIERADVVLLLVDARQGITAQDKAIAARLPQAAASLVVMNKADLAGRPAERLVEDGAVRIVLSAASGEGIELLRRELLRLAGWEGHGEDAILARERHIACLQETSRHIATAAADVQRLELCAEELRLAHESLGQIRGRFGSEELLGEIFARFCVGK